MAGFTLPVHGKYTLWSLKIDTMAAYKALLKVWQFRLRHLSRHVQGLSCRSTLEEEMITSWVIPRLQVEMITSHGPKVKQFIFSDFYNSQTFNLFLCFIVLQSSWCRHFWRPALSLYYSSPHGPAQMLNVTAYTISPITGYIHTFCRFLNNNPISNQT